MDKIYCLFTKNLPLSDEDRDLLYHTAFYMHRKGKDKCHIKREGIKGVVTTKGEYSGLGSNFGQKFRVELDSEENGRQTAEFIVSTQSEQGDGNWGAVPPEIAAQIVGFRNN